jgi:hypothetical protein
MGETNNAESTLHTWLQSTPLPNPRPRASEFSIAMPMSAPMRAWELEFGIPSHHVPTFHESAEMNRAASQDEGEAGQQETGGSG